jgi:hypothetical protein
VADLTERVPLSAQSAAAKAKSVFSPNLWFAKMSSLARSLRISNIQIEVH